MHTRATRAGDGQTSVQRSQEMSIRSLCRFVELIIHSNYAGYYRTLLYFIQPDLQACEQRRRACGLVVRCKAAWVVAVGGVGRASDTNAPPLPASSGRASPGTPVPSCSAEGQHDGGGTMFSKPQPRLGEFGAESLGVWKEGSFEHEMTLSECFVCTCYVMLC